MTLFKSVKRFALPTVILTVLALFCTIGLTGCTEKNFVGFTYTLNDAGTGYIFGCDGTYKNSELVVPAEHEGLPVVEIEKSAFKGNEYLQSVVFETEGQLNIAKKAFKSCSSLTTVTFTGKCKVSVQEDGFYWCPLKVLNAGAAEFGFWDAQYEDSAFSTINIQGGNVIASTPMAKGGTVTVSNGSRLQYSHKQAMNELTVTDDLFLSGTSLRHLYTTGLFSKTEHHGPVALKINLPQTLTHIPAYFFGNDGESCTVYYDGLKTDWDKVTVNGEGNENYTNGNVNVVYRDNMSFTVSFMDSTEVEIAAAQTVAYGAKLTEVTPADREGYTFMGWYKDKNYSEKWDYAANTVTGNLTLYAGFLENNHVHNYTEEVVAPTCTESGYTVFKCDCILGNKTDNFVDALGHSYNLTDIEWSWAQDYTATATVICTAENCPETSYEHTKTFTATISENIVKQADCKEEGKAVYTASISYGGETYTASETTEKTLPVVPHTPVSDNNAVEATCTATGLTASTSCSVCHTKLTEQQTLEKAPHTPVSDNNAVAATCSATGLTASTHCEVCGQKLSDRETVAKLEHTVVTDAAVAATCTALGLTEGSHCSICGTVIKQQQTTQMIAHSDKDGDYLCDVCLSFDVTGATEINSVAGLRSIVNNLAGRYYITADISLSGEDWLPLGTSSTPFSGVLYGGEHTISGLSLTNVNAGGLFAYNSGVIHSIKLKDFTLAFNKGSADGTRVMGGIAAYNDNKIINCTIEGANTVRGNCGFDINVGTNLAVNETRNYTTVMGGFAGVNNAIVADCNIIGSLTASFETNTSYDHEVYIVYTQGNSDYATSNHTVYFGGIAGRNTGTLENCNVTGVSTAAARSVTNLNHSNYHIGQCYSNTTAYIGSITGENKGTVKAVTAKATVSSSSTSGAYAPSGLFDSAYKIATPKVKIETDEAYKGLIGTNGGKIEQVNFL